MYGLGDCMIAFMINVFRKKFLTKKDLCYLNSMMFCQIALFLKIFCESEKKPVPDRIIPQDEFFCSFFTAHPDCPMQLTHAASELRKRQAYEADYNIAPTSSKYSRKE